MSQSINPGHDQGHEFLWEIGCEEIPARMLADAIVTLRERMGLALQEAGIHFGAVDSHGTPRRLAVYVTGLAGCQQQREELLRGPALARAFDADGHPTAAALGFARSHGVAVTDLEQLDSDKGRYLMLRQRLPGQPTLELLPQIMTTLLKQFPWPKSMRWGSGSSRFVRPIQRILALFDGQVVPFTTPEGVTASYTVVGHRFMAPTPQTVTTIASYRTALQANRVVLDLAERCRIIREAAQQQAERVNGQVVMDEGLLAENGALVEWPVALLGQFPAHYLDIPSEVLTTSMKAHQKYFSVVDGEGRLLPYFVAIANMELTDPSVLVRGYERVLRARLADAAFYWQEDRRTGLRQRLDDLEQVVFQNRLGTMRQKAERLARLTALVAQILNEPALVAAAEQAGRYAKCDLVTGMVAEFPELQGIMGGYYYPSSDHSDQEQLVARAIREHYQPQGAGDSLPLSSLGAMLALADRVDTLVGYFGMGLVPTGAKDPYALRRAALGVIRILINDRTSWHVPLRPLLEQAYDLYGEEVLAGRNRDSTITALLQFFYGRLAAHLKLNGFSYDLIDAVQALMLDDLTDVWHRVMALNRFKQQPDYESLVMLNKRIANILEKSDVLARPLGPVDPSLLYEPAEQDLYRAVEGVEVIVKQAVAQRDYDQALLSLTGLRTVVDRFFVEILVMAEQEDRRHNRFALLTRVRQAFRRVADVSCLVFL
ncbi:MAG: glycine--tRNA ligase subunit beta [Magnetococcales bacterium]|nr:glycine--tRNA ligase subunit beta [Magnetococcales bacterium]